jgi:hypothetical protein
MANTRVLSELYEKVVPDRFVKNHLVAIVISMVRM